MIAPKIPRAVATKLGHYVYVYVDPTDESVFYIGKGKGARALAHLDMTERKKITRIIRRIRSLGAEPRIDILAHGLPDEKSAFTVEAAAIELVGVERLANAIRGHATTKTGRAPLSQLVARYTKRKVRIREPAMLIRISKRYRFGMTDAELYDATRAAWKVGKASGSAQYAFAVYEGVVREVYRITAWLDGGTTFAAQNQGERKRSDGRREFVGTLAEPKVRRRYVDCYVGHLFPQGARNPIAYVNIDHQ
jgi:hypothetical protein